MAHERLTVFQPPSTPTRAFGPLIAEALKQGKTLYRADIGMPQELYPPFAKQALITAIEQTKVAGYGPEIDPGFAQQLALFYKKRFNLPFDEERIAQSLITGLGASEIFQLILPLITQPEDQIITFDPHYANFDIPLATSQRQWLAAKTDNQFHPDCANLAQKIIADTDHRIKAIYLNSPNNPTGAVYSQDEIKTIIYLALNHKLWIIWDGVYWEYNYSDNPDSILSVIGDYSREYHEDQEKIFNHLILLDSLSKTFHLCDWRLGWAMIFHPELRQALSNAASYRGNVSIQIQQAAALIFAAEHQPQILAQNHQLYQQKRNMMLEGLRQLQQQGLIEQIIDPQGGLYITIKLPDGLSAEELLRWSLTQYNGEVLTFVPLCTTTGSFFAQKDFPPEQQSYLRLCFGMPLEQIEQAIAAFARQLQAYQMKS